MWLVRKIRFTRAKKKSFTVKLPGKIYQVLNIKRMQILACSGLGQSRIILIVVFEKVEVESFRALYAAVWRHLYSRYASLGVQLVGLGDNDGNNELV